MLGAWRLGATVVPINHKLQAPEVRYILEHSKSRVLIADGALAAVVKPLADAATCLSTASAIEGLADFDALRAAASSEALADEVAGEVTLIAMPIWHASPLNNWLMATLFVGGTTVLLREYHPLHFPRRPRRPLPTAAGTRAATSPAWTRTATCSSSTA